MISQSRVVWAYPRTFILVLSLSIAAALRADPTIAEYSLPTVSASPTGIAQGPDGRLWFTESAANQIGAVTVDGVVTEFAIPTANSQPWAITAGADGNLWFTEIAANQVAKITTSGQVTEFPLPNTPIPGQPPKPNSIVAGPDGNLWFTEVDANQIGQITPAGGITEYHAFLPNPAPITVGPDGSLWFAQARDVGRITTAGAVTTYPLVVGVTLNVEGLSLGAITAGPDGNLWLLAGGLIWRLSPNGQVASYTVPDLRYVIFDYTTRGIVTGADGNLWFTGTTSNQIGRLTTEGVLTQYSIPSGSQAGGITTGPDGNIWFTETAGNRVGKLVLSTAPPDSLLNISPSALTFTTVATTAVGVPAQTLTVTAPPSTAYTASLHTLLGPNWLTISPSTNLIGTQTFTVGINPAFNYGAYGGYTGDITFGSGSFSQIIPVTLYVSRAPTLPGETAYYFPHLSLGQGWQTVLTYVNYSPQTAVCNTFFLDDGGVPLDVPFGGAGYATRQDVLPPGGESHVLSTADGGVVGGWAEGQCDAPVKASLLFRLYNGGVAQGEAGVNASTTPATEFVTFAETQTGIAYANPSTTPATVTITALDSNGDILGSTSFVLQPNAHGAANIGPLLHLNRFTGSAQITSTEPIVSLSLNAEAYPVFSSLPPGDLPSGTPLGNATETAAPQNGPATTYYFPHLAFGGGYQTTLTYVNYSQQAVSCQTTFYSDSGGAQQVPFAGGAVSSRSDQLAPGGTLHVQTQADAGGATISGWAQAQCSGPLRASLLFRLYNGGVAQGEAAVNASTTPATEFVTFAQTQTGIAYANPSATPATVTITALDSSGAALGSRSLVLQPNAHGAANIGSLLNLNSFAGSVQIMSTEPIVSLSLNAEVFPVFSSLPPGDLPAATPLASGK